MRYPSLRLSIVLLVSLFAIGAQRVAGQENVLSDEMAAGIRRIIAHRVDSLRITPAIVAGVINGNGSEVIAYGSMEEGGEIPVDGETLFEIGSISKVFTTLLLADMVRRGELGLDDPISRYLPDSVEMADPAVSAITLQQLASHTSGLPRMPTNFSPGNWQDPYADYDAARLYEYLRGAKLQIPAGEMVAYSNLGMGLLGHILTLVSGSNYEAMVKETICGPLGMSNTVIELNDEQQSRLARGHSHYNGYPVSNWTFQALAGAGAIRSTADDMLKLLAVNLGYSESGLSASLALCQQPRELMSETDSIGLGWMIYHRHGSRIIWHSGGTGGYRSFVGFCPEKGLGVVLINNSDLDNNDLAFQILDPEFELSQLSPRLREIEVAPEVLERYAGIYEKAGELKFTVELEDGKLMVQLNDQPVFPVFPSSETDFFYKVVDAQLTFCADDSGEITHLVLHQNGQDQIAVRQGMDFSVQPEETKELVLEPAKLSKYEGEYLMNQGIKIYITVQGSRLMVQLTGQPSVQVYPKSETEFFYKVVDAQITFDIGEDGKVTGLVLHQSGMNLPAKKIH